VVTRLESFEKNAIKVLDKIFVYDDNDHRTQHVKSKNIYILEKKIEKCFVQIKVEIFLCTLHN